ncbi:MAG: hypothetical protein GY810_28495 [Aureispira sp.]|nr:hypothetical protein [Aureispira sp.]
MITINISPAIKEKCPKLRLGCIACDVQIAPQSEKLANFIATESERIQKELAIEGISKKTTIQASRKGYKALGKDPSRYRLSAEALLRRIVKGKGLYQINNLVDTLNLVSIQTGYSIGGYDLNKIQGEITLGIGEIDEPYQAIGRGELNIANLPVFRDKQGAFGSPTSDSMRTMVSNNTQRFLMLFFDFDAQPDFEQQLQEAVVLFEQYAAVANIKQWLV